MCRPAPLDEATRRRMQRQRQRETKPELALRRALHARGLRSRVAPPDLPGRPDVAFTRAKIAVFVDGCYWHRCPVHATDPKNNAEWWQAKLAANVERDRRQTASLETAGWQVFRFWEHEEPESAAEVVHQYWLSTTRRDGAVEEPVC